MLRDYFTQDLYTGLILLCLILVVLASQLFSTRFVDFVSVIWNDRYSKIYIRERKKIDLFNGILSLNFILLAGLFLLYSYSVFFEATDNQNFSLLIISVSILGVLVLKMLLERIVAHFFEFSELVKHYLFRKATYRNISGLILLISNILLLFTGINQKITIYSVLIIIISINTIGFIRFLKDYQKVLISNLFYFLLYLCALEIGPYVILYKVIKDYFG